ncbi:hypothetical protein LOTGIDRAFT_112005, partial [Lottia gigantea]
QGGFARCYELLDLNSNKIYAGKIISKTRIAKPHQRQKIIREVELQRDLKHRNVVEFHSYFEDDENVYIILENCSRKSLVHVIKHRKTLSEPEVRFYIRQLVEGVKYTHSKYIIHRDLKLGNMLLNEQMELKIADFGLATRLDFEGEKKMTVCGTPNYIAPEVLLKKGHSFGADIWAIGCVMYALLVGRPPFETSTLKETYLRISENIYTLPNSLSTIAKNLIRKCLSPDPDQRPNLDDIVKDDFFTCGYLPKVLSPACCFSIPKFPVYTKFNSMYFLGVFEDTMFYIFRPLSYADSKSDEVMKLTSAFNQIQLEGDVEVRKAISSNDVIDGKSNSKNDPIQSVIKETIEDVLIEKSPSQKQCKPRSAARMLEVLSTCLEHMPKDGTQDPTEINDKKMVWVTKWVDYSNKYGFGFQLSNNSMGVLFNDTSRVLLSPDGRSMQYYDLTGKLSAYKQDYVPEDLNKKTTLLQYFARYMDEHLIQGGNIGYQLSKEPWSGSLYLKKWFRTTKAIVLYLSDGTLQVNFFDDHTKIILSYYNNDYIVTYIDSDRCAKTFSIVQIIQDGCKSDITGRMSFAKTMLKNLVDIEGADL